MTYPKHPEIGADHLGTLRRFGPCVIRSRSLQSSDSVLILGETGTGKELCGAGAAQDEQGTGAWWR